MGLNFKQKEVVVASIRQVATNASSVVAMEYKGLTANDMTALRRSVRDAGVSLHVVKNTLAHYALEGTKFACIREGLSGQIVLAFSSDVVGSAAKVMRDFAKKNDMLTVKLVAVENQLLAIEDIDFLANLPNKEGAISLLMGAMLAPISTLVRIFVAPCTKFVGTVKAVGDKKQSA